MANRYADARNGNDSNDGLSWATAKKTLGASVSAAAAGETIFCAGVFNETLIVPSNTKDNLRFEAVGSAIMDGYGTLSTAVYTSTAANSKSATFKGFKFRYYTGILVYSSYAGNNYTPGFLFEDCVFEDTPYGYYCTAYYTIVSFTRCVFRNLTSRGLYIGAGPYGDSAYVNHCTFVDCGIAFYAADPGGQYLSLSMNWCNFSRNTYNLYWTQYASAIAPFDRNNYDFSHGEKNYYYGSGDIATIAAWKAAMNPLYDRLSISVDPLFVDRLKKCLRLQKTSPAVIDAKILGALDTLLADGCSDNFNATVWDTPDSVSPVGSVIQNSNGDWVLADGYDVGAITFKLDFGGLFNVRRLNLFHSYGGLLTGIGGGPTSVLDYDKTIPLGYETWEYRIATSVDGISFGAFAAKNLNEDLNLTGIWAIKVEATLRRDM